ncbi:MAG: N-acetylmuramoyl-L-alanine amidase [Leptolyngbyaceae cyanobacterium MO_188.B28]|nr:N-acetylmuramoyl-L-alanine amidase [Leptolyngbyaceae cyanobacterium MO_188.B28]
MVSAKAEQSLKVIYPPPDHQTAAAKIFLIGTASPAMDVEVNGAVIEQRSPAGHFAPSYPLEIGPNTFTLRQGEEELAIQVTRISVQPESPTGLAFGAESLTPTADIARMPGEPICFGAIASAEGEVSVQLDRETIPLQPLAETIALPPNSAVLTQQNQPFVETSAVRHEGCTLASVPGNLGTPNFRLVLNGETLTQPGPGQVEILSPTQFQIAEVTVESGIARTGPSTSYSRITPLPKGVRAAITGREGDWLRLDYGGWIRAGETEISNRPTPPRSIIRSARSRQVPGWTEVLFPLQIPVPITLEQQDRTLTLTLHNTVPQTDTIFFNDDPAISRMDWRPLLPDKAEYTFHFKSNHQWGYKLRYEGATLILSLRHPPSVRSLGRSSLQGVSILLDPGHGSSEDLGARGPTGYPEKDVTLMVSKLLRQELEARGATVYMTREADDDLYPRDRVDIINRVEPTLALSIHYNALPDNGDALNTAGIGMFWYHPQAHDLAVFLHNYLVETLDRPSYGVFWNNLALTRPSVAPAILLELGFMINPYEFEWITDSEAQQELAAALANGVVAWVTDQVKGD